MGFTKKNSNVILLLTALLFLLIACSKNINENDTDGNEVTSSVIEDAKENCRFANESDCRPIEITRVEQTEEEASEEISAAESFNITDKPEYNITLQNLTSLSLACEAGWKCIEGRYIAYQEGNCSWHSLERCIHGCNENESICRAGPICKVKSLRCENDNLMICSEGGYKWLLNKSCDKDCENNICTEDLPINVTLNITTNITTNVSSNATNATSNSCKTCISIINFHYDAGGNDCNNLTDEYVTFKNGCGYSCDLTNWNVSDSTYKSYIFPSFSINGGDSFTLYTGAGTNTNSQLYWNSPYTPCRAIWNNEDSGGDTLYLFNQSKELVLQYTYP